jgi:penicillin-binding protein 1A
MTQKKRKTAKKRTPKKTAARSKTATAAKKPRKAPVKARKSVTKKKPSRKPAAHKASKLRLLGKWLFVLSIWAGMFLFCLILYYARDLPGSDDIVAVPARTGMTIIAHDGKTVGHYGGIKGNPVYADTLPAHVVNALLATEDRRFFTHFGIDPRGFARAMLRNLRERRLVEGGSTLTQQLAKNMFLSADKTVKRKIQEALLALWLEQKFEKEEILTAYLNRVYFGAGAYGIDSAARTYFNKSAVALNLEEGALLIGLLQAPSRYSPFNNPDLARKRTMRVLGAMVDAGYLNAGKIKGVTAQNLPLRFVNTFGDHEDRHFMDWIADSIGSFVGTTGRNLVVRTTIDAGLQNSAAQQLRHMLDENEKTHQLGEAAFVAMSPDGAVRAMVGGRDYAKSRFNRAVQAQRQPGSAFKPFVYLAALLRGMEPQDKVRDEPFTASEAGGYRPENFAGRYYGSVTLEQALAKSLNTAAVRVTQQAGIGNVLAVARRAGITTPLRRDLSLALGSSEVTLLDMVTAYAVFANSGRAVYPYAVLEIRDEDGQILFTRENAPRDRLFPQAAIRRLDRMLLAVTDETGTGHNAGASGLAVRGKTGTSQDARDAWFVGYTPDIVAGVWMGNDDGRPMKNVTGGGLPAKLWGDIFAVTDMRGLRYVAPRSESGGGIGGLIRLFGGSDRNDGPVIRGDNTERFN